MQQFKDNLLDSGKYAILILIAIMMSTVSNAQKLKPLLSGYAPTNEIETYYEVYGEGSPLILLHGAYHTIELNWGELIPELAKSRKVIAIELQGHGRTALGNRKMTHKGLAADVEDVMDHLKIERADIAGFSFGGQIAYQFAVQSPTRLNKLVIISSVHKKTGWLTEVSKILSEMKPEYLSNSPLQTAYEAVAPDKSKWIPFLEQMIALSREPFDIGDENIAKITAPVLIISGDNDGMDKIELAKTFQLLGGGISADLSGMTKSRLAIIPRQSHVSLMRETNAIRDYMVDFLD